MYCCYCDLKMPFKRTAKGKQVDNRFVNAKARAKYEGNAKKKDGKVIPERGLTSGHCTQWASALGWKRFVTEPPQLALEPLVREFYANLLESGVGVVYVRGLHVPFTAQIINEFYQLHPIEHDEYRVYRNNPDWDEIIRVIGRPNASWIVTAKGTRTLNGSSLTMEARMWQYFICARLMPETHYSTVNAERAILLYCIATQKKMDVGEIIFEFMIHAAKLSRPKYAFPHLITDICKRAGVPSYNDEITIHPAPLLDPAFYRKLEERQTGRPTSAGPSVRRPISTAATSASTSNDAMQQLQADINTMQLRQTWMSDNMKTIYDNLKTNFDMQQHVYQLQGYDVSQFHLRDWNDHNPEDAMEEDAEGEEEEDDD